MDATHLDKMIEWLDNERRKDRARIVQLEEQLKAQNDLIETITRRVGSVETDSSGLRTQFMPLSRDAELIDQFRAEINSAFEGADARRVAAETVLERRQELALQAVLRPFRDMIDKVEKLERSTDEFAVFREERERQASAIASLKEMMDALRKGNEEPDRRLTLLEEQRRQDLRRLSDTQSEITEVERQIDSLKPMIELAEQHATRNERLIIDMQNGERERRDNMQAFVDQQTLTAQQRESRIAELTRMFGQYDENMKRNFEKFETWSETYRQMKSVLDDFNRLGERLERRISEVAETQRFSEERFRQEWDGWKDEDNKRWRQLTTSQNDAWSLHDREFDQFRARFGEAIAQFSPIMESIDRLWKLERAQADLFRDRYQEIIAEYDQPIERSRNSTGVMPIVAANGNGGTNGSASTNGTGTNGSSARGY